MVGRILLAVGVLNAFPPDTLYLTIPEAEATFLRQNLLLYAEKFRIEAARALVLQARLWPNPTLSVEQIDLFAPYNAEFRPLSTFPRFYQVAANFSQTLLTAGKRLHNIALQKAALHIQEAAFADLLRNLRYDLHITLRALQRDQIALSTLARQETLLTDLVSRYEVLARSQLVPEVEYLRLQSLLQSLRATRQQQQLTYEENQNRLRQLLNLPIRDRTVWIDTMGFWPPADTTMPRLDSLLSLAASRPDVRLSAYQLAYDEANLRLQKAYAYPDVALMANYDRLGSYRIGLLGFGIGLTLPLWNRNQGQIQAAHALKQASTILYENVLSTAQSEILSAWRNLTLLKRQWSQVDPTLLATYQDAETRYRLALQNQRVGFLAYVDFFQSYRELVLSLTELAFTYHQAQARLQQVTTIIPTND
jgi:cobalt-zinc-cadmium efflux system outer membrane protein